MATRLKIALVVCLLVFILMDANPGVLAKKGGGKYKKLTDRMKNLEESVGENDCKPCQLIAETKEETAKLAEAISALSPALSSIDELKEQLNEMREEIETLKNPPTPTPRPIPTLPPTPAISDAQECHSYSTLTDATRKVTYGVGNAVCDNVGLPQGWYRFEGAAGTKMASVTPGKNHCGTHAPGYLADGHPTVAEGQVTKKVCFDWSGNVCNWFNHIAVTNCGPFYVYDLKAPPQCQLRYCGSD